MAGPDIGFDIDARELMLRGYAASTSSLIRPR